MEADSYRIALVQNLVALIVGIAWPVVALIVIVTFRTQIATLLERVNRLKGAGFVAEFDRKLTEAVITLDSVPPPDAAHASGGKAAGTVLAHDARVSIREPLTSKFGKLAVENPVLAMILAYAEIEVVLKRRLREAGASDVDELSGESLIDVALSKGEIGPVSAEAVRRSLELRNLAALVGPESIDTARALEYLDQVHRIITNIERWPRKPDGTLVDPN